MNQSLSDNVQIAHKLQDGSRQLEVLRRQTLLYQLYPEEASVMENRTWSSQLWNLLLFKCCIVNICFKTFVFIAFFEKLRYPQ